MTIEAITPPEALLEQCREAKEKILDKEHEHKAGTHFQAIVEIIDHRAKLYSQRKLPFNHPERTKFDDKLLKIIFAIGQHRKKLPEGVNHDILQTFVDYYDEVFVVLGGAILRAETEDGEKQFETYFIEDVSLQLFNITQKERSLIKVRNWSGVRSYIDDIKGKPLSKKIIEDIQRLASKGRIPEAALGIRSPKDSTPTFFRRTGTPGTALEKEVEAFIEDANTLMAQRSELRRFRYFLKVAQLYIRFIKIHPLHDGNGTTASFLVDHMIGSFEDRIPEYKIHLNKRVPQVFRRSLIAIAFIALANSDMKLRKAPAYETR